MVNQINELNEFHLIDYLSLWLLTVIKKYQTSFCFHLNKIFIVLLLRIITIIIVITNRCNYNIEIINLTKYNTALVVTDNFV